MNYLKMCLGISLLAAIAALAIPAAVLAANDSLVQCGEADGSCDGTEFVITLDEVDPGEYVNIRLDYTNAPSDPACRVSWTAQFDSAGLDLDTYNLIAPGAGEFEVFTCSTEAINGDPSPRCATVGATCNTLLSCLWVDLDQYDRALEVAPISADMVLRFKMLSSGYHYLVAGEYESWGMMGGDCTEQNAAADVYNHLLFVPEPSSGLGLLCGISSLGFLAKRRRSIESP